MRDGKEADRLTLLALLTKGSFFTLVQAIVSLVMCPRCKEVEEPDGVAIPEYERRMIMVVGDDDDAGFSSESNLLSNKHSGVHLGEM